MAEQQPSTAALNAAKQIVGLINLDGARKLNDKAAQDIAAIVDHEFRTYLATTVGGMITNALPDFTSGNLSKVELKCAAGKFKMYTCGTIIRIDFKPAEGGSKGAG